MARGNLISPLPFLCGNPAGQSGGGNALVAEHGDAEIHVRHRRWGVFGDRYKAVLVEGIGAATRDIGDYIHLNPVLGTIPGAAWRVATRRRAGEGRSRLRVADGLAILGVADSVAGSRCAPGRAIQPRRSLFQFHKRFVELSRKKSLHI